MNTSLDFKATHLIAFIGLILLVSVRIAAAEPFIINHTCTAITQIPQSAIEQAKATLHIAYGHTSHGSQLTDGMTGLVDFANDGGLGLNLPDNIFQWNKGGTDSALDLHDYAMGGDVGYYPAWVNNTRQYLGAPDPVSGKGTVHPDTNVVIWSWCGQVDEKYAAGTLHSEYLTPMTQLEVDYPGIFFIYMTGHVDIWNDSNNKAANQVIRNFCSANNKILYDFADIERYNPDGEYFEYVNDSCNYYSAPGGTLLGNWATEWQNSHAEGVDWYSCGSAHTEPLNANLKTYAAWWLWARLAGWNPSAPEDVDNDGIADDDDNCPNIKNSDQADSDYDGLGDVCDDISNIPGDINGDKAVDMDDLILSLQSCAGFEIESSINLESDVDGDNKIGMPETLFILNHISGAKMPADLDLDITAPVNGEKLTASQWYEIIWRGSSPVSNIDIELSTDAGATYPIKIVSSTPNDGNYVWGPVPFHDPTKLSSSCKIRIKDSAHPTVVIGQSDGLFTLQSRGEPMLLQELCDDNDTLAIDPLQKDTDDDGLYDNVEIYLGTDPLNWDSDRDGYDDYREIFPDDVLDVPVPDKDFDGMIAALDNDDDDDGINDGRNLDSDSDGIPDYLEIYGFTYNSTSGLKFFPWNGDIEAVYYKTNPRQATTDQDHYSDYMEITKINMDVTVKRPGDSPMIAAFPNFIVNLTDYDVALNSIITETDGTVHTDASTWDQTVEESNSTTDEWHLEESIEVSASYLDFGASASVTFGVSQATTTTSGTATSHGGEMSDATQWSEAVSTNPSEAAKVRLHLAVQNVGTCIAEYIGVTLNVKISGKSIATLTHPEPPGTISMLAPGESYSWVSDWITLTMDELRAVRTGAPISIEVTDISADVVRKNADTNETVGQWGPYFAAAESTAARLFLDLGDGTTTEHLVYAGANEWEPVVTLRDALIWAANGQETAQGPTVRFYQPGGSLGDAALLDDWYFSLDQGTYDEISSYLHNPDFNLFDTVLTPGSVIVAKAPPINPTPDIHWAVLSPRNGTVTAYVDDYFFTQKDNINVWFVDKYGNWNIMYWDPQKLCFACACPTNADGSDYFKDGTEKIVAQNAMYNNPSDSNSENYRTEMPVSEMQYQFSFDNIYPTMNHCSTTGIAQNVFANGDYAYVADGGSGLQVIDVSDPAHPVIVGACDTSGWAYDVTVSGDFAYVTNNEPCGSPELSGLQVVDISDPENPSVKGFFQLEQITGIYVKNNLAYLSDSYGLSIVDVADPSNIIFPGTPPYIMEAGGGGYSVFMSGSYVYVADGDSGLQVIDVSDPENPVIAGSCDTPGFAYDITVSGDFAYVTGGNYGDSGLQVINIRDPLHPIIKGTCDTTGSAYDVFVSDRYAYVADGDSGLQVINVSDPENPIIAGTCDTYGAFGVFVSDRYAYVADGGAGLQVIDISDPENPDFKGTYNTPGYAQGVFVSGYYAYVADGYSGLQVINISDPENPVSAGSCDTPGFADDVFVSDRYAYVADDSASLHVINVTDPSNPRMVASIDILTHANGLFVKDNVIYFTGRGITLGDLILR